jgi:hypothetical protein
MWIWPRSILAPAIFFFLMGAGLTGTGMWVDSLRGLMWVGGAATVAAFALILRKNWGRLVASMLLAAGYLACAILLVSLSAPARMVGTGGHLFFSFLGVLAVVAILTLVSGCLWSREATAFLAPAGTAHGNDVR